MGTGKKKGLRDLERRVKALEEALKVEDGENRVVTIPCRVCGGATRRSVYAYICQQEFGHCGVLALRVYKSKNARPDFSRTRWRRGGLDDPYVHGVVLSVNRLRDSAAYIIPGRSLVSLWALSIEEAWGAMSRVKGE